MIGQKMWFQKNSETSFCPKNVMECKNMPKIAILKCTHNHREPIKNNKSFCIFENLSVMDFQKCQKI